MTTNRPLKVFLCHSSNDKPAVRELYQKLRAEPWIEPWLDEEELHPGQTWEIEIEKAVESSDVVVVCLSNNSINKRGYVQKELRFALDIALEMPEETIFIIPLRLEECTPPRSLRDWQYADYFPETQRERALQRLLVSLKRRTDSMGLEFEPAKIEKELVGEGKWLENFLTEYKQKFGDAIPIPIESIFEPKENRIENPNYESDQPELDKKTASNKITLSNGMEFMRVPAGKFLMGSDNDVDNENPQQTVDIPYNYWMARFPVTNELYNEYVKSKGGKHPVGEGWKEKKDHPVVKVSWNDAMAYCQWLNSLLKNELPSGLVLRLPTEAEWEKAARSTDGLEYPWGNQFDKSKCNTSEGKKGGTTPVGYYSPQGDSPYGCADMSGNVWEWTHSLMKAYPYNVKDGREDEKSSYARVLRGGSFNFNGRLARCAYRYDITFFLNYIGFRVVVASPNLSES